MSLSMCLAVALSQVATSPNPLLVAPATPDGNSIHLGVALRLTHATDLEALLRRQQDPSSADYRRWLTASDFGKRFGQPAAIYDRAAQWLQAAGFSVTPSPNRLFLDARGTVGQANQLLSIKLQSVAGAPAAVHVLNAAPTLPGWLQPLVLNISGLDTRVRYHHRLLGSDGKPSFGPQDLRRFYGAQGLLDQGFVGQGQQLAVLGEAETEQDAPSAAAIRYYLRNVSDSSAAFKEVDVVPGTTDFDPEPGGGGVEFALDTEMQSVGSPGADSITLVISPASEVFTTGANYIVNQMETVTAVSVSLGICELGAEQGEPGTISTMAQALKQGLAEGQTWSAATGDQGSDDCRDGLTVAVDFPSSIPEMVAAGGTQLASPNWDAFDALTAYQLETVWNGGNGGGAGGGGTSILYATPSYQTGFPFTDAGRSLPDIALISGAPAVLTDDPTPGILGEVQGTSVASPLSAGFFALIASRVGCRLGDVHPALYMLGNAQLDGGPKVFHDITAGNNSADGVAGQRAAVGYDRATGWGSLDVQALAEAWPPCPPDAGFADAGPGRAYDPCAILDCPAGTVCTTLTEGPSSCVASCALDDAGSCGVGTVCSGDTPFSADAGVCVEGCHSDLDCADAGQVCSACNEACEPPGRNLTHIGSPCVQSSDCPSGGLCEGLGGVFSNGYCTQSCTLEAAAGAACSCPSGSSCGILGFFNRRLECLQDCTTVGVACGQSGFVCQPDKYGNACLPECQIFDFGAGFTFDLCQEYGAQFSCDTATGVCSVPLPDAGTIGSGDGGDDAGADAGDAGEVDAGEAEDGGDAGAVQEPDAGASDAGTIKGGASGCGCSPVAGGPDALWGLIGLGALLRRRRERR